MVINGWLSPRSELELGAGTAGAAVMCPRTKDNWVHHHGGASSGGGGYVSSANLGGVGGYIYGVRWWMTEEIEWSGIQREDEVVDGKRGKKKSKT